MEGQETAEENVAAGDALSSVPTLPSPQGGTLSPDDSALLSDDLLESLLPQEEQSARQFAVPCWKVVLAYAVRGTLVLTTSSMTFMADDTCEEYERVLSLVSSSCMHSKDAGKDCGARFGAAILSFVFYRVCSGHGGQICYRGTLDVV